MKRQRTALKVFRVSQKMTQAQFAEKLGCSHGNYSKIESGQRKGTQEFWLNFQATFNIADGDMWNLMKIDE